MSGKAEWTPLRIADAGRMATSGLFGTDEKDTRVIIRRLVKPETRQTHVFAGTFEGDETPRCVGVITIADHDARRGIARIDSGTGLEAIDLTEFIRILFETAFFKIGLHRVELLVGKTDQMMSEAALAAGLREEALLKNALFRSGRHQDARSFVMLRPQNGKVAYGFVSFAKGLVAVRGTADLVDRVEFLRFGEAPGEEFLSECAAYRGYVGDDGRLVERQDGQVPKDTTPLPAEVAKACAQIGEYFNHQRSSFDLHVSFPAKASEFQLKVWRILGEIAYGHVWTYEDVAAELVAGPREDARKMSRAVGTACATNPVPLIVPCHRVIGKDGKLTGFSGGVDIKEFLLAHEWIAAAPASNEEGRA